MIVRDEERNLAACLSPVADLFDEIVIVDTGSKDNTKQIASNFTPHVYDFEWCDDFAAARNESLRHATGDWIFWLDADDRLCPAEAAKLRRLLDHELTDHPRVFLSDTVLAPVENDQEPALVTHTRLFRRSPSLRWEGRVHEQLKPEPATLGYEQVFVNLQIQHVGYCDEVIRVRKERRSIRLLRMDYVVDPNKPTTLLHLGMSLACVNRTEAQRHLERLVAMDLGPVPYLRRAYCTLAELLLLNRKPAEAVKMTERGLALFPDDEHLLFVQASAWYRAGNYPLVTTALRRIIGGPSGWRQQFGATANVRCKLAPRLLGTVYRLQKAFGDAECLLQDMVRRFPTDNISWYDLGMVYVDAAHSEGFAWVVRELSRLANGQIDAGVLTALWSLRHGDVQAAGPIIDQLVADAPLLASPRMLRCEWLSRCGAPWAEQAQALRDFIRIDPDNGEAPGFLAAVERAQAETIPLVAYSAAPPALAVPLAASAI